MTQLAIETEKLTRKFGRTTAVSELSLQIPSGIIYGFLGPNGCGKTTTLRMLTGLLIPSEGSISVLGYSLPAHAEIIRQQVGYMTQKFSLYGDLTVSENMQFTAAIYGINHKESRRRISELLNLYNLTQQARQLAGSMSGGQRQRLALAAATIHKPKLLFLDEPTSAVDPQNRRDFWEQLFDLCEQGTTILVSTHYMDEAERCHRLAIMEKGNKRADGSPEVLMQQLGAHVIELEANDLRQIKQTLTQLPEIISAAQLGARLRILIADHVQQPVQWIGQYFSSNQPIKVETVRPSLEDVFVTCTDNLENEL